MSNLILACHLLFLSNIFVTARVCSTREGNVMTLVCTLAKSQFQMGMGMGGTPSSPDGGYPQLGEGIPTRSQNGGEYPIIVDGGTAQDWMGVPP